jgi:NMD protein affecting ribosome stability and mRNA decay
MSEYRICDNCGRWVEKNEMLYIMEVAIMAEPNPEIKMEEPQGNAREELEKLVEAMEDMTEEQIDEATDQVHENYRYTLCAECREVVHRRLKHRSNLLGE